MKRIGFKEWLYNDDGEMTVTSSLMIPTFSFLTASVASGTIEFRVLPIALVVQFLYVLIYYLFDSRIR